MAKRYRKKDPFKSREAEKYDKPIPSREYILQYLEEIGEPVVAEACIEAFGLHDEDEIVALKRRLRAMARDGQLMRNRRGRYVLVDKLECVRGRVVSRKDGFGFVIPDAGGEEIYLSSYEMQALFPDDTVLVQIIGFDKRGRCEGRVIEILERNTPTLVGRIHEDEGMFYVIPDKKNIHHDILVKAKHTAGAETGQYVQVEIIEEPSRRRQARGRVIEILGDHLAPGMEIEVAIRGHGLRHIWPDDVLEAVKHYSSEVQKKDLAGRKDLRDVPFVTIDGVDAQDFDDAVYCEPDPKGGWQLYVAIADVSHYVEPGSPLDNEGFERANSVYFPGRVIPMLPEALANGLCSLRPKVDRLVMVCQIQFAPTGEMLKHTFYTGVIHSHARLTYGEVAERIQNNAFGEDLYSNNLMALHDLYKILHKRRGLRGALDFETTETRIVFGAAGKIKEIVPVQRNDAHKLIEECMLRANVATAQFLKAHNMPVLYRVHEGPTEERLQKLKDFLKGVGLRLTGGDSPTSKDYARLLDRLEGRNDGHIIQMVLLRSLRQAIYTPQNVGHFGLAYDTYCHFTSPIRRYPDLLVHRAIKHVLDGQKPEKFPYSEDQMIQMGRHCSTNERNADLASRDVEDWLKCHYMMDKVGNVYDGIIGDITNFGMFIKLKDVYVEGLLHITALENDYFIYDAMNHKMVGRHSGKVYKLGGEITVQVARVDLEQREIDFALAGSKLSAKPNGRSKAQGAGRSKSKGPSKTASKSKPSSTSKSKSKAKTTTKTRSKSGGKKKPHKAKKRQ